MYTKELDILRSECANCTISLSNIKTARKNFPNSCTSLQFENTDLEFISTSEDVTNFQAVSYIFRLSPELLENNIKKYLATVIKNHIGNPATSVTGKDDDLENSICDPLESISLSLCQKCSKVLTELYSVHYKFEQLSKKNSIISKGVGYSNSKKGFELEIKSENDEDKDTPKSIDEIVNPDDRNVINQEDGNSPIECESDVVKEEPLDLDFQFSDSDQHEDNFWNEDEIEQAETAYSNNVVRTTVRGSKLKAKKRLTTFKSISNDKQDKGSDHDASNDEQDEGSDRDASNDEQDEGSDYNASTSTSSPSEDSDSEWSTSDYPRSRRKRKLRGANNRFTKSKKLKGRTSFDEALNQHQTSDDNNYSGLEQRPKYGGNSLRCLECKIYFRDISKFLNHHQIYHSLVWKDYSALEKWWQLCGEQSYNCGICDEFFISELEYEIHLLSHSTTGETNREYQDPIKGPPYTCPKCDTSCPPYENWPQLQIHGCKVHKLIFQNLVPHTERDSDGKRKYKSFFCKYCSVPFSVGKAWSKHMALLHPSSIICEKCYESFSDQASLLLHEASHDTTRTQTPKQDSHGLCCTVCDKNFRSVKSVWMHRFVHIAEERELNSNICLTAQKFEEFVTTTYNNILPVDIIYKSETLKPANVPNSNIFDIFCCKTCNKGFASFYSKKIHQSTQFIVDFDSLEHEMLIGSEFICPKCGVDFKRNIILREHCLTTHNLIISTEVYPVAEFLKELKKEKDDCVKFSSACEPSKSLDEEGRKKAVMNKINSANNTGKFKSPNVCPICLKVCTSYINRHIHETLHKIDLSKVEIVCIEGTNFVCPRCGEKFMKNYELRKHCLRSHNVIASTKTCPGEKFLQFLKKEQKSINERQIMSSQRTTDLGYENSTVVSPSNNYEHSERQTDNEINNIKMDVSIVTEPQNNSVASSETEKAGSTICDRKPEKQDPRSVSIASKSVNSLESSHICEICGRIFRNRYNKNEHVVTHFEWETMQVQTITPPYNCPNCKEHYLNFSSIRAHCISVHGFNVSNTILPKVFKRMRKRVLNTPHETTNRHFLKGKTVESTSIARINIKSIKKNNPEKNAVANKSTIEPDSLTCPICKRTLARVVNKNAHVITHFDWETMEVKIIQGPPYICTSCGEQHTTLCAIRAHCISTHSFNVSNKWGHKFRNTRKGPVKEGPRPIKSKEKQNSVPTVNESGVLPTTSSETEERFLCDECGKVFTNKHALHGHRFVHAKDKPFVCEKCGASFKRPNDFRRHKLCHFQKENGIRPKCNICGRSYISSKGLSKHKADAHPIKNPIPSCTLCNKTFTTRTYALAHIKKHRLKHQSKGNSSEGASENI